jgi:hypothetical protein
MAGQLSSTDFKPQLKPFNAILADHQPVTLSVSLSSTRTSSCGCSALDSYFGAQHQWRAAVTKRGVVTKSATRAVSWDAVGAAIRQGVSSPEDLLTESRRPMLTACFPCATPASFSRWSTDTPVQQGA